MQTISVKSFIGHKARELLVHASRLGQRLQGPRLVIFLSQIWGSSIVKGSAADLRGIAIGRALRALGWRVTIVPPQLELAQRIRLIQLERPSVILLQQTRHPLNHPRFYLDFPCVLDVDDADILEDPKSVGQCAACCRAVVTGSSELAHCFSPYNKHVHIVWTGSYLCPNKFATPPSRRPPIVAWAHSIPFEYPLEARLIQDIMLKVATRTSCEFWLYGVKDTSQARAYLEPLEKAGVKTNSLPPMTYRKFVRSLENVAVGLHPVCPEHAFSRGKSFGKLLAYMAAQVPIVASRELDHPLFFRNGQSATLITNNNADIWATAILELINDFKKRDSYAAAAGIDYKARLTTRCAAEKIDSILRTCVVEWQAARLSATLPQ